MAGWGRELPGWGDSRMRGDNGGIHPHPSLPPSRGKGGEGKGRRWVPAFARKRRGWGDSFFLWWKRRVDLGKVWGWGFSWGDGSRGGGFWATGSWQWGEGMGFPPFKGEGRGSGRDGFACARGNGRGVRPAFVFSVGKRRVDWGKGRGGGGGFHGGMVARGGGWGPHSRGWHGGGGVFMGGPYGERDWGAGTGGMGERKREGGVGGGFHGHAREETGGWGDSFFLGGKGGFGEGVGMGFFMGGW